MKLAGKSREELADVLADKTRSELLELIFSLVTFERLLSARDISERSLVARRDVLADMKAGKFADPIFGAGFFCRASHSLRVTASAANAWRRSFFVPAPADLNTTHKNRESFPSLLQSAERERAQTAAQMGVSAENLEQKRAQVRDLSPAFLARK